MPQIARNTTLPRSYTRPRPSVRADQTYSISTRTSCQQIEAFLANCESSGFAGTIDVLIEQELTRSLLLENWALIAISSLLRMGAQVNVVLEYIDDWTTRNHPKLTDALLPVCLVGLCQSQPALRLKNQRNDDLPRPIADQAIHNVAYARDGILRVGDSASPRQIAACHFDPDFPVAPLFETIRRTPGAFKECLADLRWQVDPSLKQRLSSSKETIAGENEALYEFVDEIDSNSLQHGRYDRANKPIEGVRFLKLQRWDFKQGLQSPAFGRLADLPSEFALARGISSFLEISISDFGLGIVERFLVTRGREDAVQSNEERRNLLLELLTLPLTSKRGGNTGEGQGLKHALQAVDRLHGLVSLRTDRFWLLRPFNLAEREREGGLLEMRDVDCIPSLSKIPGTHWNLWLPIPE